MMNYTEFITTVKTEMEKKLGPSYDVSLNHVIKVNTEQDALTIFKRTDKVAPNIYLGDFYNEYQNGECLENVIEHITNVYFTAAKNELVQNYQHIADFNSIKDKIAYKIINPERNKELLSDIPHRDFFNLSIVLYCILDCTEEGTASFLIHNNHLDIWETDADALFDLAFKNTPNIFPMDIKGIQEALFTIEEDTSNDSIEDLDDDMFYVLTNNARINGFSCILYPNVLETFSQRFGSFYILPSSLHEALLVPTCNGFEGDMLDMVKTVNATEVSPEDFLADSVYFYDSETNQIQM